jgi:hypothetical protein
MTLRVLCIIAALSLAITGCDSGSTSSSGGDTTAAPQSDAGTTNGGDAGSLGSDAAAAGDTASGVTDGGTVVGPDDAGTAACQDACNQGQSGCDGNMTWTCDYNADGCLTQFQGTNCAALGQVCDPQTGTCKGPDGGTPDKLLCPDILPCALENCDPSATDFAACANAALQVCGQQADSPNEVTLFNTWQTCLQTNCAAAQTDADSVDCMRTFCLPSYADCYTGGSYGMSDCSSIDGCAQASCAPPITSACIRGCMSDATAEAVIDYFDLSLCAQGACTDATTDQEFQACFQQAIQSPVCGEPYLNCAGAE